MPPQISLIATVYNEAPVIDALMEGLLGQERLPDEIVIVDGGSCDDTWQLLQAWQRKSQVPLRLFQEPGCNIASGRNCAIRRASGTIIAVTDAGVRLPANWLRILTAPFQEDDPPDVASGFFAADPHSLFERVLGAITLPRISDIDPAHFAPSSRSVAFKRTAWERAGGYPEWLDYCEDLVFDFALRDAGLSFAFVPEAVVWFRPRPTLRDFYRQYYRYARGDGKADLYFWRHVLRYACYLTLLLSLLLALLVHPAFLLGTLLSLAVLFGRAARRLLPELTRMPPLQALASLLWLPVIVVTGDVAKMVGYPVGVAWRCRHGPKTRWARRSF